MPTTFRTDQVTGIVAVLDGVKAAHPTLLLAAYPARPEGLPDLPCAFVENRPETIRHDSGTRTRTMSPSVIVVRRPTDNRETMLAFDALVDILVDAFTASPQFAPNTIWSDMTVSDEDYPVGDDYILPAVRFTFPNVSIMEGRV